MIHVLWLPDYTPVSLNVLMAKHWAVRNRLKKEDKTFIGLCAYNQRIPKATGKRRMSLRIILGKGMKRKDEDNIKKSLVDALVHSGLLKNDSPDWVEHGSVVYSRGEKPEVFIILEDV